MPTYIGCIVEYGMKKSGNGKENEVTRLRCVGVTVCRMKYRVGEP